MEKKEKDFTPQKPQLFDTACRLFAGGTSKKEISDALNVAPNTISYWSTKGEFKRKVAEYQKNLPSKVRPPKTRKVKEFHQACQLEATTGFTPEEIAVTVGVTVPTIKRWKGEPEWEVIVNEYKANRQHPQRQADDKEVEDIIPQFLSTLKLRDLKNLCISLKRNTQYQSEIQKIQAAVQAAERAHGDSEILQKLENFCTDNDIKDISATQLRNKWSERLKPPDDKPDE